MTRPLALVLALLAAIIPLRRAAHAAPVPEDARFALVIGNSGYTSAAPVQACATSANLVSATLRRAGFVVTEQLDPTIGEIDAALGDFTKKTSGLPASSVTIYVCGYAVGFNNRTFLLPVSAALERDTDVLAQGIVAKSLPDAVLRSSATGGLVLIDAVAWPKAPGSLALDTLTAAPPMPIVGVAAFNSASIPPEGATPLAAALADIMKGPDIDTGTALAALRKALPDASLAMQAPAQTAWLAGGPPSPVEATPAATSVAVPATPQVVFPAENAMSADDRRRIQAALAQLGYYDGRVDSVFGPESRAAIRRFQHEIGSAMTGVITPEQAGLLVNQER